MQVHRKENSPFPSPNLACPSDVPIARAQQEAAGKAEIWSVESQPQPHMPSTQSGLETERQ